MLTIFGRISAESRVERMRALAMKELQVEGSVDFIRGAPGAASVESQSLDSALHSKPLDLAVVQNEAQP